MNRVRLLAPLFLLSGTLALVYEVLWMRMATVAFGASAPATAATLAAMFVGMAAGSAVCSRVATRIVQPLRVWGLLEFGIAAGALLVVPLLELYQQIFPMLHAQFAGTPAVFIAVKTVLALLAFFPATFCMGATLPVVAQCSGQEPGAGRLVVALYAANTFGAATGAWLVPHALLPALGAQGSILLAVTGSAAIGVAALTLNGRIRSPSTPEPEPTPTQSARASSLPLTLAFLSGLLVLALETLCVRVLALVHESSVHAFALVIAVFLLGLGGGALLARALLLRAPRLALPVFWCLAGLVTVLLPRTFFWCARDMEFVSAKTLAAIAFSLLIPPALLAGAVLPLLLGRATGGRDIGRLLAANTLGSILGPLAAAFVLAPRLGLWSALTLLGLLMIGAGVVSCPSRAARIAATATAGVALLLAPRGLPAVRVSAKDGERVVSIREGYFGTVAVIEDRDGDRRIKLDNHYVLGGTASLSDERMQGCLPLLLHPRPERVLFLGLGTGITASASLLEPAVRERTAVELVPEVTSAAAADFSQANLGFVTAPGVEIVSDDARSFLSSSGRRFDVIVGDLFVPWRPGEASLYTEEAFRAARAALASGGLYCQWAPLWQLSRGDLAILLATFSEVFPGATLWRGDFSPTGPALALCGGGDGYRLDAEAIDAAVLAGASARRISTPLLASPAGVWIHLLGSIEPDGSTAHNRDATPWLELSTHAVLSSPTEPAAARLEGLRLGRLSLDDAHQRLQDAGGKLGQATLLAAREQPDAANGLASEALRELPDQTRDALLAELGARPPVHGEEHGQ